MKILKSFALIILLLMVGVSLAVLTGQGSSGKGGKDIIIDLIGGGNNEDKDDEDNSGTSSSIPDISKRTYVLDMDYNFSGNEVTGYVWNTYNMNNVRLQREDGGTEFDGVLDLQKDSLLYTVPSTTNRLADKITFPFISMWDYSRYFAYDFTLSSTQEYPCGLTFSLISDIGSGDEYRGEKLFVMRQDGQDVLFKERCFAYYEDVFQTEYDEETGEYTNIFVGTEPVYKYDTVTLGSLAPNTEYHFTFIIDGDQSTFDVEDPSSDGLLKASYAYVYLNGEFFTTLGFNINEMSEDGMGEDIEYALGIEFDTKYKTVNAGSNILMTNFLYAGTKALDYIYSNHADCGLSNYYVADIFSNANRYISLYKNPDWYYYTAGPIMTEVGTTKAQNVNVLHLTQVEDEYRFRDETINATSTSCGAGTSGFGDMVYVDFEGSFQMTENSYFIVTFDFEFTSNLNSEIVIYFEDVSHEGKNHIYLKPVSSFDGMYLYITKNGTQKCYGYLLPETSYRLTFVMQKDGLTHLYVNGRWLTSIENYLQSSDFNFERDSYYCDYLTFKTSDDIELSSYFNLSEPSLNIMDSSIISSSDTYFEYIFTQPMAYLYYNSDWSYYNLSK